MHDGMDDDRGGGDGIDASVIKIRFKGLNHNKHNHNHFGLDLMNVLIILF